MSVILFDNVGIDENYSSNTLFLPNIEIIL